MEKVGIRHHSFRIDGLTTADKVFRRVEDERRRSESTPLALARARAFVFGNAFDFNAFIASFCADTMQQQRRADRIGLCGQKGFVWIDQSTGKARLICQTCKDRFCSRCRVRRAGVVARAIEKRIEGKPALFITLTQRVSGVELSESIATLVNAFRSLRKLDDWKVRVKGGVAFIETKWSERANGWHTHLHMIAESAFFPVPVLIERWKKVTGGSSVVDVKRIDSVRGAASYVAGYAGKAIDDSIFASESRLRSAMEGLAHRRQFMTFGSWHGKSLLKSNPETKSWSPLDSVASLLYDADRGAPGALAALANLCGGINQVWERLAEANRKVGWPSSPGPAKVKCT